ncbi:MAG: hypothetical protein JW963_24770 [Anaerolineales bacterium]|nr:hypothetical protein [Anaerolineales bacterium]
MTVVGILAYLPFVGQFGYFNDDWYLMYSAGAKGPTVFFDIFSIDRPLRAFVMIPAYVLFGANPLWYNLSAFFFRLLSAFGFVRLSAIVWPRQRVAGMFMGILFLIYPGFLSQFNGIDYQSQMIGLAAAVFSIVLTLEAIRSKNRLSKLALYVFSGLLAWLYIGLVEYFIGFELVRLGYIFLLVGREKKPSLGHVYHTLRLWFPALVMLIPILVWRLFFFESERNATDVGYQLSQLVQSPLATSFHWLSTLLDDTLDVIVLAWAQPLVSLRSWIWSLRLLPLGVGLGIISVAVPLSVFKQDGTFEENTGTDWRYEAIWFGAFSVIAGLIPIILVNRYVDFTFYSRYALTSSLGVAMLLVGLIFLLKHAILQKAVIAMLIFVASLTHFANSQRAVQVTQAMHDFWWQVSWRIPQLERHTTLVANYGFGVTEEDYFVWGPANLIYHPESERDEYVQPGIYAALLNEDTIDKTLRNKGQEFDNRRTIRTYKNYRRLLVLTRPTAKSCVHVIDGTQPEYSSHEQASIQIIGPYSNLDYILTDMPAPVPTPPAIVFGPEPEHDWCYYYQKATLARQRGDWDEILTLGEDASSKGLAPVDLIEWMPFLQAYARVGDIDRLVELAPVVSSDPYIAQQACKYLGQVPDLAEPVFDVIDSQYCNE